MDAALHALPRGLREPMLVGDVAALAGGLRRQYLQAFGRTDGDDTFYGIQYLNTLALYAAAWMYHSEGLP